MLHDFALPFVSSTDVTPLTSKLPPWGMPVIVIGSGVLFEWLRHCTTQSLGENKTDAIVAQLSPNP